MHACSARAPVTSPFPQTLFGFGEAALAGVQTAVTQMTGSPHYQSGIPRLAGI